MLNILFWLICGWYLFFVVLFFFTHWLHMKPIAAETPSPKDRGSRS